MPKPPPSAFVGAFNMMLAQPAAAPQLARFQATPSATHAAPTGSTLLAHPPQSVSPIMRSDRWTLIADSRFGTSMPGYGSTPECLNPNIQCAPLLGLPGATPDHWHPEYTDAVNVTRQAQFLDPMRVDTLTWDSGPSSGAMISQIMIGHMPLFRGEPGIADNDLTRLFGIPMDWMRKQAWAPGILGNSWLSILPARLAWMAALDTAGYHDAAHFVRALMTRGDLSRAIHDRNIPVSTQIEISLTNVSPDPVTQLSFRFTGSRTPKPKFG